MDIVPNTLYYLENGDFNIFHSPLTSIDEFYLRTEPIIRPSNIIER